ncbi:MAG: hypothetical protein WKF78_06495 [Candidatus Limnocylindrales bacterium]
MTTLARAFREPEAAGFGRLPLISVIASAGLVLVAIGDGLGRADLSGADLAFWAGITLIVLPVAVRLLDPSTDRDERLALLALMAIALYIVKVMHSPAAFSLYDEIQHLRTADDIIVSGRLYGDNPLLLVSPLYPGLEIATTTLTTATGTSPFEAGVVIVEPLDCCSWWAPFCSSNRSSAATASPGWPHSCTWPIRIFYSSMPSSATDRWPSV